MTNSEIRRWYLSQLKAIERLNEDWKRAGVSAERRARDAFEIRRQARLDARRMMADPLEVELLRRRDQAKYGNPDGPTFDQLLARYASTLTGDAVYEEIIRLAARTDAQVDKLFGDGTQER